MSAVRMLPSGSMSASSGFQSRFGPEPCSPGCAVALHDPVRRDVDEADDRVLLLGRDHRPAVGVKNASSGTLNVSPGAKSPGRGNSQSILPVGSTSTRRLFPSSAIRIGPGSTEGSDPTCRLPPIAAVPRFVERDTDVARRLARRVHEPEDTHTNAASMEAATTNTANVRRRVTRVDARRLCAGGRRIGSMHRQYARGQLTACDCGPYFSERSRVSPSNSNLTYLSSP